MGKVERQYGITPTKQVEALLYKRYSPGLLMQMKTFIEFYVGAPIRKVCAYEEKRAFGGYCDTCSYDEYSVRIYFKSSEGKLCMYQHDERMTDFVGTLLRLNA